MPSNFIGPYLPALRPVQKLPVRLLLRGRRDFYFLDWEERAGEAFKADRYTEGQGEDRGLDLEALEDGAACKCVVWLDIFLEHGQR